MRRTALGAGDPEVEDLRHLLAADLREEDVFWLQIPTAHAFDAVRPAEAVRAREGLRDRREELHALVEAHRRGAVLAAARDDPIERLALEPLEREERHRPAGQIDDVDVERPHDLRDRL